MPILCVVSCCPTWGNFTKIGGSESYKEFGNANRSRGIFGAAVARKIPAYPFKLLTKIRLNDSPYDSYDIKRYANNEKRNPH